MPSEPSHPELTTRLSRLVDGLLDAREVAELEAILIADPSARDSYRHYLGTHLDLSEHFRAEVGERPVEIRTRTFRSRLGLSAVALVFLFAGLAYWWSLEKSPTLSETPPTLVAVPVLSEVLAVVSHAEKVRWNLPESPAHGLPLRYGTVRLEAGLLGLDLVGSQRINVRAPAEFKLLNETEMFLQRGEAALRMIEGKNTYIIKVPSGALVDLGTEFSVRVGADGSSDVHVYDGLVAASFTDENDRTRVERLLHAGESASISETLGESTMQADEFLRITALTSIAASSAGDRYAAEVRKSRPMMWWRFEEEAADRTVPDEVGGQPVILHQKAAILGTEGRRFLQTDAGEFAGFAAPAQSVPGLDTPTGMTAEVLLYSSSEDQQAGLTLENPSLPLPDDPKLSHVRHAPTRFGIERSPRRGKQLGHLHADFAVRGVMRSPAGHVGGINVYSSESHLLHRWVHVVFTNDGSTLRLYIDGKLSDMTPANLDFREASLRPIIGRLHSLAEPSHRQWIGGIDEVAFYDRVLTAEEILAHFRALE